MKNIFAIVAVVISTVFTMSAQTFADGQVEAQNVCLEKVSGTVMLSFDLDVSKLTLSANKGLVLTPVIAGISDTLRLPAIECSEDSAIYIGRETGLRQHRTLLLWRDVIMATRRWSTMPTRFPISRG